MIKKYPLLIAVLIFVSVFPLRSQVLIPNSSVTGVCYAGNKVTRIYIPPPDEFFKKSGTKGGASITVYYSGFSNQARIAVEKAVTILKKLMPADTKLTILASWEKISTSGVLGQSTITGYAAGWGIDALNPLAIYPVSLAEKIAGQSLNDDLQGDITLAINSSINWYLGTDGQTPKTQYDLVTVALHEICHGLGFFDSMDADGINGWYGIGSMPMIYDTFVENFSQKKLTDTTKFANHSAGLRSELIGGQLYFNGPLVKKYTSGSRARLFSPSAWDAGSSVSHLDESEYKSPNPAALMTPYIDLGEAIHNPGDLTRSLLGDIGWINTRIIHKPISDSEAHLSVVQVSVQIKSDTLFNRNKVGVVFSFNNFLSSDTLLMYSPDSDNTFKTSIIIPSYNTDLQYYFFAEDYFQRLYRSPSLFKMLRYEVYIGTDTVKPVITHTPQEYYLETVDSIKLKADAVDNLGIASVSVEYKVNSGPAKLISLKPGIAHSFSAVFSAKSLALQGGDLLNYRIIAVDSALSPNTSFLPKTGYFAVRIEDIGSVVTGYTTDFAGAQADFFNIGFEIAKPATFNKFGLHTKHPYESPESNGDSINYISILRHPLKFSESGMFINYNEIVLVEPGEAGSVYGSQDFYDYVIVEGSVNFGKSWFALTDGYDSRYFKEWETAYKSSIVGDNSTFTGVESMIKEHSFYLRPSAKISAGDTLLIRFRLFSDPYANGWGWVLEDLKINPLIDAVEKNSSIPFTIFPNPGNGIIKLASDINGISTGKPIRYSVFNSSGICIKSAQLSGRSDSVIDISGYSSGLYIIVIYLDDGIKTIKYNLVR